MPSRRSGLTHEIVSKLHHVSLGSCKSCEKFININLLHLISDTSSEIKSFKSEPTRLFTPEVSRDDSVTHLKQTPIFEWCVVGCGSQHRHQEDIMYLKEIGLHAQNLLIFLSSIVNIIGGTDLHGHFMSSRIFALKMIKIFI